MHRHAPPVRPCLISSSGPGSSAAPHPPPLTPPMRRALTTDWPSLPSPPHPLPSPTLMARCFPGIPLPTPLFGTAAAGRTSSSPQTRPQPFCAAAPLGPPLLLLLLPPLPRRHPLLLLPSSLARHSNAHSDTHGSRAYLASEGTGVGGGIRRGRGGWRRGGSQRGGEGAAAKEGWWSGAREQGSASVGEAKASGRRERDGEEMRAAPRVFGRGKGGEGG
jgi:hypothetical protein